MAATTVCLEFDKARGQFHKALEDSVLVGKDERLISFVESYEGEIGVEKRTVLDQVFRDILCQMIRTSPDSKNLKIVINFAVQAVKKDFCSPSTPFLMMADVFDMLTLAQCEEIFGLVEDNVTVWKSEPFYESGKNYLLRMCNDLIRRLSKSQNTVFCGRIQIFLSRLFPLSEKSALNLASQFNLENLTIYTSEEQSEQTAVENPTQSAMEVDDGTGSKLGSIPIDYHLYKKFWSLQDFFRKPTQCYDKASWQNFSQNAEDVMAIFSSYKLDDLTSRRKEKAEQQPAQDVHNYFAKYLTSEKLLNLQLNDSNFRRYVLVQFLILFQYLKATVKFKTQAHTLSSEQSDWVKESEEKVAKLLCETPPHGEQFYKSVKHVLEREEHWNNWKNESCPSFIKEKSKEQNKSKTRGKRRRIGDEMLASGGKFLKLGSPELTRLWNLCPDNLEACKSDSRTFLPALDDFFADAIEQADPEAMVEEQYKDVNHQNFQWKAFRLLARTSPHFFVHTNTPGQAITVYLNDMVNKMAKEIHPNWGEAKQEITAAEDEEDIKDNMRDNDEEDEQNADEEDSPNPQLNKGQIDAVANTLSKDWMKVGERLSIQEDDLQYYKDSSSSGAQAASTMLTVWQEEDPDRDTISLLTDVLKDLGLKKALSALNS